MNVKVIKKLKVGERVKVLAGQFKGWAGDIVDIQGDMFEVSLNSQPAGSPPLESFPPLFKAKDLKRIPNTHPGNSFPPK